METINGDCSSSKSKLGLWNVLVAAVRPNLYSEGEQSLFPVCIALLQFSEQVGE